MKKLVLVLAIAVAATSYASAQLFVSGSLGLDFRAGSTARGSTTTDGPAYLSVDISPALGYYLSEKRAIGAMITLGYSVENDRHDKETEEITLSWGIEPFVRERILQKGDFSVWLESALLFGGSSSKTKYESTSTDGPDRLSLSIGVLPLLTYNLTEKLSLEASSDLLSIGFHTYTDKRKSGDTTYKTTNSYFGAGINAGSENIKKYFLNPFEITLTYKF